jgi:hypothetical protein
VEPSQASGSTDLTDPDDRRRILACLKLTPEERLMRVQQAHEFFALIREAQPLWLRER